MTIHNNKIIHKKDKTYGYFVSSMRAPNHHQKETLRQLKTVTNGCTKIAANLPKPDFSVPLSIIDTKEIHKETEAWTKDRPTGSNRYK